MLAMNYSNLRNNMRAVFDKCTDDYETVMVTRKNNKNIVCMSEEEYNNLMENLYVRASKANYDNLKRSISQARSGRLTQQELLNDE